MANKCKNTAKRRFLRQNTELGKRAGYLTDEDIQNMNVRAHKRTLGGQLVHSNNARRDVAFVTDVFNGKI